MKEIKRDGAIINYQVVGTGDTTLLFVHGSYIDQTYWKDQVKYFKQDYTIVTLDLPGHGKSGRDRKDWSIEGFAEDIITIIKELNLRNVILIGHSWGAAINLIAATSNRKPVLGFICIDYFKNAGMPMMPDYEQQAASMKQKLESDFANTNEQYARMALLTKQTPPEITSQIINTYRNAYQPMAIATTPEIFKIFKTEKRLLAQLQLKLYLINVDYIPTNEDSLKQNTGNGYELMHIEGTCHYPMLENPRELNKLLQRAVHEISEDKSLKKNKTLSHQE